MVNYKNGKIYKIQCNKTKDIYVGSTCCRLLCQRLRQHVHSYKQYLNGTKKAYTTSFKILKDNDYKIILIEKVPCGSKDELIKRERYYIETLECVNKNIPGRTKKEYQKEYQKEYYEEHKEERKEYKKKYYEENKEELIKYQKEYSEENKEKIKERDKKYYEDNKEEIKEYQKEYREEHKEEKKLKQKEYYEYIKSWGGDKRFNNNLLSIDIDLFT